MRQSWVFCPIVGAIALPSIGRGADTAEPIRLEYVAPAECKGRDAFVREIAAMAPRARIVAPDAPEEAATSRLFVVHVLREARGSFRAELGVRREHEEISAARELSAATCDETTRAAAFVVALSIDPRHLTAEIATAPVVSSAPGRAERIPEDDSSTTSRATNAASRWTLALGADADGAALIPEHVTPAFGMHVEIARGESALRLAFRRSVSTSIAADSFGGKFQWTWGRLEGCPLHLGSTIFLQPCALLELGEIDAEGTSVADPHRRGRPWLTMGVLGRFGARWGRLLAGVDVGCETPLSRESFVLGPSPLVYRPPSIIPFAGLSVGAELAR